MRVLYTGLVLLLSAPFFLRAADVAVMEEIVAKVNGEIITTTELKQDEVTLELTLKQQGLAGAQLEQAVKQGKSDVLRDRIDALLMLQKGKDMNYKLEQDVNRRITDLQRQFNLPDPEAFQRFVMQETGKPYEEFRQRILDEMIVDNVRRDEVFRKIQVGAVEMRDYYDAHQDEFQRKERVMLRELLVSTAGKTSKEDLDAAEAKAKDLAARAKRGEAFTQMVTNNSDSPTKDAGGMLEPFTKDALNAVIAAQVWDKEPGYITDPIRFDNGWEIFKVEDHHREGLASYAEVEPEIQDKLFRERAGPAIRAYLTQLREQAFLQIKKGYVDSAANPAKDTTWGDVATLKPQTITKEEVIANPSMKRLLGMIPVPGTQKTGASSSR